MSGRVSECHAHFKQCVEVNDRLTKSAGSKPDGLAANAATGVVQGLDRADADFLAA